MLGYITDKGLNNSEGSEKFSARFNTNINIADKFVLMADFYAHRLQVDRLMVNNDGHGLYRDAWKMNRPRISFTIRTCPNIMSCTITSTPWQLSITVECETICTTEVRSISDLLTISMRVFRSTEMYRI